MSEMGTPAVEAAPAETSAESVTEATTDSIVADAPTDAVADSVAVSEPPAPKGQKIKIKFKQGRKNRHGKQKSTATKDAPESGRRVFHQGFKFKARKRSMSFPAAAKFFLPYMRPRKETIIPPTKFLLGGNISDPLNLNSLRDEDVNRAMNAVTPKSSPLPTPPRHKTRFDVIIPPNIRDPLNLLTPLDNDEYEKQLEASRGARRPRKRTKSKRRQSESAAAATAATATTALASTAAAVPPAGTGNVPARSPPPASPVTEEPAEPTDPAPPAPHPAPLLPPNPPHPPRPRKRQASESEGKDPKKLRRLDSLDKIVSPVIPQPGAWMRVHPRPAKRPAPRSSLASEEGLAEAAPRLPKFNEKDLRFQYGNYDRYYGYRNLNAMMDVRLKVFELNRHLFVNKDVLDVGCNVGHIAIAIARDFGARSVTGIDIDDVLIGRARRSVSNSVIVPQTCHSPEKEKNQTEMQEPRASTSGCSTKALDRNISMESTDDMNITVDPERSSVLSPTPGVSNRVDDQEERRNPNVRPFQRQPKKFKKGRRSHKPNENTKQYFPISCPMLYGPTEVIGFPIDGQSNKFPQNISFKQGNYILKDENLINAEPPQYDLIMCLSVTKWFHLNWGDAGIKLAFKRMFAQLRPGGKLILEAQAWASYKRKKRLTETIYKNFSSIEFFPNKFKEYLLSPEVGFSKCCTLGVPQHLSKGFRRPIHLYIKGDFTPSKVQWSDTYAPSHHQSDLSIDEQPKKVYAYVVIPSYHPNSSRWSENNTPSYGAATPCALQLENNSAEESPFYNPRSDSYMPSYSSSGQPKTVYASLSSPQSDYGGTPSHMSEGGGSQPPHSGIYTTLASPASPFLEPSPGNSTTPSHPFTPSHSASYDVNPANKKVYASLHSPHEDIGINGRGQPVYSPSVAGTSRRGTSSGHSPLYTGSSLCPLPEANEFENTNSDDSVQVKSLSDHLTPAASPSSDVQNAQESGHNSPRDSNDTE